MNLKDFRENAHQLVDWMADYLENINELPVVPDVAPGEIRAALPPNPPAQPDSFDKIMGDFKDKIVTGMTHWQHPGWFAYFPANSSPPSVLAEMLAATMGAQCMSWQTSPAATELEQVVMDWLRQMIGLPETFTGVIQDTASTATLVAFLCARERATDHKFGQIGPDIKERLCIYASDQSHSSIPKGVKLAGYGLDSLRSIESDEKFAIRLDAFEKAIENDLAKGRTPACAVATIGTTSSGAVDPIESIASICRKHDIWLHVDAAWAGSAAICPEHSGLLDGVDQADSFLFNPHKWLFTNFDCTAYFAKDTDMLLRVFTTSPEYLRTVVDAEVANLRDWQIQLGRRFRALKLWFVIRSYGVEGLQEILRRHIALAGEFAQWIQDDNDFELLAPVSLALVCFRFRPQALDPNGDEINQLSERLLAEVNKSGEVHLTHTELGGRYAIRMSIGQLYTQRHHVERAWELIKDTSKKIR